MELKTAIEILEAFNAYRRYRGDDIPPLPISVADAGIALDVAIAALKNLPGPNWDEAPEWAQWWSIDEDGEQKQSTATPNGKAPGVIQGLFLFRGITKMIVTTSPLQKYPAPT